jgi:hypothetical protein
MRRKKRHGRERPAAALNDPAVAVGFEIVAADILALFARERGQRWLHAQAERAYRTGRRKPS